LAEASDRLRRTGGKKVYELRVRLPWDKGGAVAWLLDGLGLNGPDVLPLYLGDDETDEDAFAMLCERGGVGVLVAPQPQRTLAHYRLDDPDAVGRFLHALLEVVTR
ncbi:MAG: trehalose-phosphatase, partial [Myxococcales bacterium]|nr:trehalose-phosphatase [Myxococcales bacterium]